MLLTCAEFCCIIGSPLPTFLTESLDNTATALGVDNYENVTAERDTEYILFQSLVMGSQAAIGRAAAAAIFANLANICNFMQCE